MIHEADKYSKGKYTMPNRDNDKISPSEKDSKAYNLQMAQYIYHTFCNGSTYISYNDYSSVERNRSYAYGEQSQQQYMDVFSGSDKDQTVSEAFADGQRKAKRKGAGALNYEIQSPAPRMMDALIGKLSELVNVVSVDANDKYSGAQKENAKWGAWVDKRYMQQFNSLKALMALPTEAPEGFTPANMEELNLYEAEGGFKPSYAVAMERLLKYSFERSAWDENIVEKVLFDLVSVGFAAGKDVYDPQTGQVKCEYLNARTAGVQYTDEESYRKPDYGFYIKMVRMSDLKERGFKEDQLNTAAKKFSEQFGNSKYEDPNSVNKSSEYGYGSQSDEFIVPVLVCNWIDVDHIKEVSRVNRYGKKRTRSYDEKEKLGKKDELIKTRVKTVREVHWIIDTDLIYDYGKVECHGRDGLADPVLPIHMVKVMGKPIIPRLIPALDLYMNSWMKFQQGIRMATIDGFAIDMSIINNINLGNRKMTPKEVIRAWRDSGTLFFSSQNTQGRHNVQNTRPIERLDGGAGQVMQEQVSAMDFALRQIEELTGINPLTMGATPDTGVGKAVNEYSIVGTSDILKNIVKKANILKSDIARNMTLRLNYVVQNKPQSIKAYEDVVGEGDLQLLKIAQGNDVKYGIRTHARPTQQDIAELKEMISLSLKNGRDGKVGITEADYVRFNYMINAGESLKRVAMLLGAATRKAQRESEERAMRAQQMDAQNAQALNQQKAQQDAQKIMMESQAKLAEERLKGMNNILDTAVKNNGVDWREALAMMGVQAPQAQPQQEQQPQQQVEAPATESAIPQNEEAF